MKQDSNAIFVNYYSPEDEVLRDGDGSFELLGREFAWYNQETRNGFFPLVVENEAGWEFNSSYDIETTQYVGGMPLTTSRHLTGQEASALGEERLRTCPFFSGFHEESVLTSPNGVAIASNLELRARTLAYGIPAESFAAGASGLGGGYQSFNMTTFVNADGTGVVSDRVPWTHSAFVALPLNVVSGLFENLCDQMKGTDDE